MPSVVFMGRKPGAVVAFEQLLSRSWEVPYVVTAVETEWLPGPSLRDVAKDAGVRVIDWKPFLRAVKRDKLKNDAGASVDWVFSYLFPYLITQPVLQLPKHGALNFHPAPLPDYGGLGGYNFAILEEREEYGVTCHFMDESFDTGDLVEVRRFPIDPGRATALSLEQVSQQYLLDLFCDILERIDSGDALPRTPQQGTTRYIDRDEFERQKRIPAGENGEALERRIRAFWYPPYDGALLELKGNDYTLASSTVLQAIGSKVHAEDLLVLRRHVECGGQRGYREAQP